MKYKYLHSAKSAKNPHFEPLFIGKAIAITTYSKCKEIVENCQLRTLLKYQEEEIKTKEEWRELLCKTRLSVTRRQSARRRGKNGLSSDFLPAFSIQQSAFLQLRPFCICPSPSFPSLSASHPLFDSLPLIVAIDH